MKTHNIITGASIICLGLLLTWLILRGLQTGGQTESQVRDIHAGHEQKDGASKHLRQEQFELDIGLAETKQGPPRFEAGALWNDKSINPQDFQLSVTLKRPDGILETLSFKPEGDRLENLKPVAEPHVFQVQVTAKYREQSYHWQYWQVENGIELDAAELNENSIEIETAGPATIESVLTLPGQIRLDPRRVAHVVPRVEGIVTKVDKYLGDSVKKNEILTVLESPKLADLKSQYLTAWRGLDLARITFERERQLWQEKISAELDYLQAKTQWEQAKALAEAARQKLIALDLSSADLKVITSGKDTSFNRYELRAPFAGEVVEKHLALGEGVKADAKVYTIADLSRVWVEIMVYSKDLNRVHKGQAVTVRSEDLAQSTRGTVFYIEPLVGEQTRSAKAYVEIPNPRKLWRSGLFVTVDVLQASAKVPVAVAADAIQTYRNQTVVFVRHGDFFEPRRVVTGLRGSDSQRVEIWNGLEAGERYAAQGSFVLKSELGKSGAGHHH